MKHDSSRQKTKRGHRCSAWVVALWALLFMLTCHLNASPRTSANYAITTDTADAGGTRTTSASYTCDGSAGGISGISSVGAPVETAKHGYIGQLYEVTALQLAALPATVDEEATRQLSCMQLLDDLTSIAIPAPAVTWNVLGGPLSMDSNGLATAAAVYENTAATVQGAYFGNTNTLLLTVLDTVPDNFGSYAGDGLGDDWQVQYFGLDNPAAGPGSDPDGDGQDNLFEFTAGLVPTDPLSRFALNIAPVPGQHTQQNIIFGPIVAGRTYTVEYRDSLTVPPWALLTGTTQSEIGDERTVTDTGATGPMRFYHVIVAKP